MPDEPDQSYAEAMNRIREYRYRKLFKMTEQEYLQESMDTVNSLLLVDDTIKDREKGELNKAKRGRKR